MCDTDSMAIVATEAGGLIACPGGAERLPDGRAAVRALSWAEVDAIRSRIDALNPYDRAIVTDSMLKLERENLNPTTKQRRQVWCFALSAKRYALYNLDEHGRPLLRKVSEHGLGHLLSPTDPPETEDLGEEDEEDERGTGRKAWMHTLWEGIVTEALGKAYVWPAWLDRPALGRITASSPEMLRPFRQLNKGKPYAQQVKPYNFLLTAYVQCFGHPEGVDPTRFHLVAPFESDPRKWRKLPWVNLYDDTDHDHRYTITTTSPEYAVPGVVHVKTYRDVLDEYRAHAETKSLAPDGSMCSGSTIGLLRRRPVTALYLTHVGKESTRLEEVEAGLVHDPDEVYTTYHDPEHDAWQTLVVPVLKQMPRRRLMEQSGLDRSSITRIRTGHRVPHHAARDGLIHMAAEIFRAGLQARGMRIPPRGDLAACAAYLQVKGASGGGGATGPSGTTPAGAHHFPMVMSDQF